MRRPGSLLVAGALLGLGVLVVPLLALVARTPWGRLTTLLTTPEIRWALWLSLWTSLTATLIALALGAPLALLLARGRGPWVSVVRVLVALPLVLPPVAAGMALLAAFGRRGVIGELLGLGLPFTPAAVVLAQLFVAMPFLVITLEGGLRRDLRELEEAAATCGASRWQILWYVTLPVVRPALAAGTVLAWARALGEFGATVTFAGNLPMTTQTVPLALYLGSQHDPGVAYALATVMLVCSSGLLLLVRGNHATS